MIVFLLLFALACVGMPFGYAVYRAWRIVQLEQFAQRLTFPIGESGTVDPNKSPLGQALDVHAWQLSDEAQAFSDALATMATAGKITLSAKHEPIEPYMPQPEYVEITIPYPE